MIVLLDKTEAPIRGAFTVDRRRIRRTRYHAAVVVASIELALTGCYPFPANVVDRSVAARVEYAVKNTVMFVGGGFRETIETISTISSIEGIIQGKTCGRDMEECWTYLGSANIFLESGDVVVVDLGKPSVNLTAFEMGHSAQVPALVREILHDRPDPYHTGLVACLPLRDAELKERYGAARRNTRIIGGVEVIASVERLAVIPSISRQKPWDFIGRSEPCSRYR